ncbi:MAG: universal stress protein [Myxococcales bacterium]|jgi:nucleotide-binding universal stress UspA family protein
MTESISNRIVVGTDMSETGNNAIQEGMRLSRAAEGGELHVTYVIKAPKEIHDAKKLDQLSSEIRGALEQLQDHVQSICAPPSGAEPFEHEVVFHVRLGDPAQALHQVAVDMDADLIVVGTHARKGVEKLILGSVAEELMRSARCSVVVAHPKNFEGLEKSSQVEAPRPGQQIHDTGLSHSTRLSFRPRTSHVSGLI